MNFFSRKEAFWITAIAVSLVISWGIWVFQPEKYDRRVLFFPNHYVSGIGTEERALKVQQDFEPAVEYFVQEYMHGPAKNRHFRLFPLATRLKTVFVAEDILFIDLDFRVLRPDPELRFPLSRSLEIFTDSVKFNFPSIREIVWTVEGRIPDFGFLAELE